jgi:integrase
MRLSDVAIRKIKPGVKPAKLSDGGGLYLLVNPTGSKLWRWKYRVQGREKLLSLGAYPTVSLATAREACAAARRKLNEGTDPSAERKQAKQAQAEAAAISADTFEAVARDWMAHRQANGNTSAATIGKDRWRLETYLFPEIGSRPVSQIDPRELRSILRKIEESGKLETASRTKINAGQVFRWAILEGRAHADPTATLRGLFTTPTHAHRAALTDPVKIGGLLRAIDGYTGQFTTLAALKLAPLTFVRPGELRKAEWPEFDLDGAIWRIPAARMKMKAPHLVPLSTQAVEVLRKLYPLTGDGTLVFPATGKAGQPMSENTVNLALRRLGYAKSEMTGHGFRSMAATRLNEMGWNADAIERQLAHAESNKVRAAYTHAAQYLQERTRMMQAWADYLDGLRAGANVLPIRKVG